jgi:hypothetical protein
MTVIGMDGIRLKIFNKIIVHAVAPGTPDKSKAPHQAKASVERSYPRTSTIKNIVFIN